MWPRSRCISITNTLKRSKEWRLKGLTRLQRSFSTEQQVLKAPEDRYKDFLIGFIQTNDNINKRTLDDVASKCGLTVDELMDWYQANRGDYRETLSYYRKKPIGELKAKLAELGCIAEGKKDTLAYRLFLAKSNPNALKEQRLLKKKHDLQKMRATRSTKQITNQSSFLDHQIREEDLALFTSVLDLDVLREECEFYKVEVGENPVWAEVARRLTKEKFPGYAPRQITEELAAHYFSKFAQKELRDRLAAYRDLKVKEELCRTNHDLGKLYAQALGFDVQFDADFFIRTLKFLSRRSKEELLAQYAGAVDTFRLTDDKTLLAHRILERFFTEYDANVFQVNYVRGLTLSYQIKEYYRRSLRDPESVFAKILELRLQLPEDVTYYQAIQTILDRINVHCEGEQTILDYELHQFVHFVRTGKKNSQSVLKFYCEMTGMNPENKFEDGFFTRLLTLLGFENFEEEKMYSVQMDREEEEEDLVQPDLPASSGSGFVVAIPKWNVIDFQTDGVVSIGQIVHLGANKELEVLSCVSKADYIYRAMALKRCDVEIDDEVKIRSHTLLLPELKAVKGQTFNPLGDTIQDDIFNTSQVVSRTVPSFINTFTSANNKPHKNYWDFFNTDIIPTQVPAVDCLFPLVKDGVHVAVASNIEILRKWLDEFTIQISQTCPVIHANFYPSESVAMAHGSRLRTLCKNDLTIVSAMFSDEELLRWHSATTAVQLAYQSHRSVLMIRHCNFTNESVNSVFSKLGAFSHPKLYPSKLGHVPLQIKMNQPTRFPTVTTKLPQVYGIPQRPDFTTVLGVVVDSLELPYAREMFEWAHSVWVIENENPYLLEPYVSTEHSGSAAVDKDKINAAPIDAIHACRQKLHFGTQLAGITQSQKAQEMENPLHEDHEKFLSNVYKPLLEILKKPKLDDPLREVENLHPDRDVAQEEAEEDPDPFGFDSPDGEDDFDFDFDDV